MSFYSYNNNIYIYYYYMNRIINYSLLGKKKNMEGKIDMN